MRSVRSIVVACVVLGLAACSSATLTRMAYNNAALAYTNLAPMLTWMVDDYVDLDGGREDWVRGRLDRVLAWHRAEELPRYRALLQSILEKSEAPFRVEDIAAKQREIRAGYHRVLEHVIPDTAEFLATLDSGEAAQIERKFIEDNRKYVKESVRGTPEERIDRRAKRFIGHLESWVGSLESPQRALVFERYRDLTDLSEELLGERRFRQGETLAMLKARSSRTQVEASLKKIFINTESWRRPEYQQKLRERDAKVQAMIADLSATLTDRQRAALQKRIGGLIRDIDNLTSTRSALTRTAATPAS